VKRKGAQKDWKKPKRKKEEQNNNVEIEEGGKETSYHRLGEEYLLKKTTELRRATDCLVIQFHEGKGGGRQEGEGRGFQELKNFKKTKAI